MTIRAGDVVPTKSLRVVIQDGAGWMNYKPPARHQFVLMLLGSEPIKGEPKLAPVAVLHELGWRTSTDQALKDALRLASNRLLRCSVDHAPNSRESLERAEWSREAAAAISPETNNG